MIFPFAGATKYSFRTVTDHIGHDIRVITTELPGHGSRFGESALTDVASMVEDATNIIGDLEGDVIVWGHSLGALIAYEYARRNPLVKHLVVSGRAAPGLPREHPRYSELQGEDFYDALRNLGGTPEEILSDPEIMSIFEPVLRADFKAAEDYSHCHSTRIDIPITVLVGTTDICKPESAMAWARLTTAASNSIMMKGGHFFPMEHGKRTARFISSV